MANENYRIGGFIGLNNGEIIDCYSDVKLSGCGVSGGFCGENRGLLKNCFSKGSIRRGKASQYSGFCGLQSGRTEGCFWICNDRTKRSKEDWNDWDFAVLSEEMKDKAGDLFKDWDQNRVWKICPDGAKDPDPKLLDLPSEVRTRGTVREIGSGKELLEAAREIALGTAGTDTTYRLTEDIDLRDVRWEPIGADRNVPFSACMDGAGHTIKNFRVSAKNHAFAGFFGYIGAEGEVRNLILDGVIEDKGESVAIMCGCNEGLIDNCVVRMLCSSSRYTGGFAAQNLGVISRCCVIGKVKPPPLILWWWPLVGLALLGCLIPALFAFHATSGQEVFAPVIMDPNAKPIPEEDKENPVIPEEEAEDLTDTGAGFIMNAEMTVDRANYTGAIGLRCPAFSARGFIATATVSAQDLSRNGSSYPEDAVIYKSGLIPPDYGVDIITLSALPDGSRLPAGTYDVTVWLDFYDLETNERAAVNSSAPLILTVK